MLLQSIYLPSMLKYFQIFPRVMCSELKTMLVELHVNIKDSLFLRLLAHDSQQFNTYIINSTAVFLFLHKYKELGEAHNTRSLIKRKIVTCLALCYLNPQKLVHLRQPLYRIPLFPD